MLSTQLPQNICKNMKFTLSKALDKKFLAILFMHLDVTSNVACKNNVLSRNEYEQLLDMLLT